MRLHRIRFGALALALATTLLGTLLAAPVSAAATPAESHLTVLGSGTRGPVGGHVSYVITTALTGASTEPYRLGPPFAGEVVHLHLKVGAEWTHVLDATTDDTGRAVFDFVPEPGNHLYRFSFTGSDTIAYAEESLSSVYTPRTNIGVVAEGTPGGPGPTSVTATLYDGTGTTTPLADRPVRLEEQVDGAWTTVDTAVSAVGGVTFTVPGAPGERVLRVAYDGDATEVGSVSEVFYAPLRRRTVVGSIVRPGVPNSVEGWLYDYEGGPRQPIAGQSMRLERRFPGSLSNPYWRLVSTATTDAYGEVKAQYTVTTGIELRWVFPAAPGLQASEGVPHALRPGSSRLTMLSQQPKASLVAGQLMTTEGALVAGQPVTLQYRTSTAKPWATLREFITDANGGVQYNFWPTTTTYYRWSYAGTPALAASTSKDVALTKAKSRLVLSWSYAGRPDVIMGNLTWSGDGTAMGRQTVYLQQRFVGTSSWRTVRGYVSSRYTGDVSARVQPKRPTYYRWYFPGTKTVAPAVSRMVRFRY
jgi:hypothetical protein